MNFNLGINGKNEFGSSVGSVTSTYLDGKACTGKELGVLIESRPTDGDESTHIIESFQMNSLNWYFDNYQSVQLLIEEQLITARANWLNAPALNLADVWTDSKLRQLWLPNMRHNLADGGGESDTSMLIAVCAVRWDEEHVQRTIKFRNGKVVSFGIDGD